MRVRIGPASVGYRWGRPYLASGYQLEPTALVLSLGKGIVEVPPQGPPKPSFWGWVAVMPVSLRVTDPIGRRYTLWLVKWRLAFRGTALLAAAGVAAWRSWRRRR